MATHDTFSKGLANSKAFDKIESILHEKSVLGGD